MSARASFEPSGPLTHSIGLGIGSRNRRPPGPFYWTPYGAGWRIREDPLGYVSSLAREYGDIVCLRMGPIDGHLLHHPDAVKHVPRTTIRTTRRGPSSRA